MDQWTPSRLAPCVCGYELLPQMRQKLQKVDIIFRSELLIKGIEDEAKKRIKSGKSTLASSDAEVAKGKTSTKIAEMAGTT